MVRVGGPVANIIAMDLNPHLAVNFDWRQVWRMESSRTGRPYADEQVGLIAKVRNPWNPSKVIVSLGGLHATGTMAAILGLTHQADEVLEGYRPGDEFYRVVAGEDRDGDGRPDAVSILEWASGALSLRASEPGPLPGDTRGTRGVREAGVVLRVRPIHRTTASSPRSSRRSETVRPPIDCNAEPHRKHRSSPAAGGGVPGAVHRAPSDTMGPRWAPRHILFRPIRDAVHCHQPRATLSYGILSSSFAFAASIACTASAARSSGRRRTTSRPSCAASIVAPSTP